MDQFLEAARLTLLVTVRLGIPVLVLCGLGLLLYHSTRREASWWASIKSSRAGADDGRKACCWLERQCLPAVRDRCPAFKHPEAPCWQVTKAPTGSLRTECLSCAFFLPYLRQPRPWAKQPRSTAV